MGWFKVYYLRMGFLKDWRLENKRKMKLKGFILDIIFYVEKISQTNKKIWYENKKINIFSKKISFCQKENDDIYE